MLRYWANIYFKNIDEETSSVNIIDFLSLFRPGSWNMKQEGGIQVAQVPACEMPTPVQVERLKERAKTMMIAPPPPPPGSPNNIRSLEEVRAFSFTFTTTQKT